MMRLPLYSKTGNKGTATIELPKAVFEAKVKNHELLHQAVRAHMAHNRSAKAKTLTRGLVQGGGKKPWRQKGTGRARAGSIRSPIWRGGGVTFGPTGDENYRIKLSVKAKRAAIRQALSLKAKDGQLMVIEDLALSSAKTKDAAMLMDKLNANRSTLLVVGQKSADAVRATNNLPQVKLIAAAYLSAYDLLWAHQVIITKPALAHIEQWLAPKPTKSAKAGSVKSKVTPKSKAPAKEEV